jgi:hypothetical protein
MEGHSKRYRRHPLIQAVVCGDEVACGKPAPDCFLQVAAEVGVQAADCLVIEDAPAGEPSRRFDSMRVSKKIAKWSAASRRDWQTDGFAVGCYQFIS